METRSDIELVEQSKGGNSHAFEHLVKRHYMTVYRISYKWCGIREEAEDIAQEVFVKIARKLETFTQRSSFKTWLYRITMNTAKDFAKKRITRNRYESAYVREQEFGNPASSQNERIDASRLHRELCRLPEKQKAAILLVFDEVQCGLGRTGKADCFGRPRRRPLWTCRCN